MEKQKKREIKMKRILTCMTAVLLVALLLAACGAKTADLSAVMSDVNSQFSLSDLKTLETADDLNRYYQIDAAGVKQFAAELSTTASRYTEVILVEGTDANAAADIKTKLEAHLASQLNNAKSYDAEQVSMLEGCSVQQSGNFVWLVVSESSSAINAIVSAAL